MAARFFCDNCQTQVNRDTKRCPRCGRHFAFVRCPKCDFTGEEQLFAKGCPVCGYCTAAPNKPPPKPVFTEPGRLPLWVYFAAALGLAAVLVMLYYAML